MIALVVAFVVTAAGMPAPVAGIENEREGEGPAATAAASLVLFGFIVIEPAVSSVSSGRVEGKHVQATVNRFRADATRPLGSFRVIADVVRALIEALARLGTGIVFLWHRVQREGIGTHPTRRRILDFLGNRQGITFSELAVGLGLNRKTAEYHVRRLVAAGRLVEEREPPYVRLFVVPRPAAVEPLSSRRRVLAILRREGPMTRRDLAARLGITPQGVSHHVLALEADGAVERRGSLIAAAR